MQEADAERRIQILRGLHVDKSSLPTPIINNEGGEKGRLARDAGGRERKRRRVAGEDDTDRDIRLASERSALASARPATQISNKKEIDTPLTDSKGHINLFPAEGSRAARAPKNAEAEAEAIAKKKEFEDQYTMRFSNAAGFKQAVGQAPWYYSARSGEDDEEAASIPPKDVWGNEDPSRKEREKQRLAADDPLALMQKGVSGLRKVESERKKWKEERERERKTVERRPRKKMKREAELEDFSLDQPAKHISHHRHRHHHHHHHSHKLHDHPSPSPPPPPPESKTTWQAGRGGRYSDQFAACLDIG